jgi:nucleoside-diphosphate-sugar epimerase
VGRNQGVFGYIESTLSADAVLVTGSDGFVGSHLCAALAAGGRRVVAASRRPGGVSLPLLSNASAWQSALKSIDCVVHLAAHVHIMRTTRESAALFQEVNVRGSQFVAEQAAQAGVRRFVYLSTVKVNGEGGDLAYRAADTPQPADAYARSKMQAEEVLRDAARMSGMELAIIRPPLVYGPGVRANFRRLLQLVALGLPLPLRSVDNRRSLVSVWNLVNFIELCATHPRAGGGTWLVSDGEDLSTPQLLQAIARSMHKRARLFAFPPTLLKRLAQLIGMGAEMSRLCDSLLIDATPAANLLGWKPIIGVQQGLERTVAAFLEASRR